VRTPPAVLLHPEEVLCGHNRHLENPASNTLQISNRSAFHAGDLQGNSASKSAKAWATTGFIVKRSISVCAIQETFTLVKRTIKGTP